MEVMENYNVKLNIDIESRSILYTNPQSVSVCEVSLFIFHNSLWKVLSSKLTNSGEHVGGGKRGGGGGGKLEILFDYKYFLFGPLTWFS